MFVNRQAAPRHVYPRGLLCLLDPNQYGGGGLHVGWLACRVWPTAAPAHPAERHTPCAAYSRTHSGWETRGLTRVSRRPKGSFLQGHQNK